MVNTHNEYVDPGKCLETLIGNPTHEFALLIVLIQIKLAINRTAFALNQRQKKLMMVHDGRRNRSNHTNVEK